MKSTTRSTVALMLMLAAGSLGNAASAQELIAPPRPAAPAAAQPSASAQAAPVTFTDEEFGAVARMLTGCWKATIPGSGEVVMGMAPVRLNGMTDCLYSELAMADTLNRPFRQTIWQIHRVNGKVRLKTLEFRTAKGRADQLVGMWAAPEVFPATIGMDDLVATMDVELTKNGSAYHGKTLQPYPTTISNAVEMTGEVKLDGSTFWTADRGFNAEGKQVWGPATDAGYTFQRFDGGPRANRLNNKLVVIDYASKDLGAPAMPGQPVTVEYIGYLENGTIFDASFERGSPFVYAHGDSKMIEGWSAAMADARKGQVRRVIVPGALGIMRKDGKAPVGSKLIYDVKVLDVGGGQPVKPPPVIQTSNGAQPTLTPVDPNDPAIQKMQEDMRKRMEAKRKAMEEKAKQDASSGANPAANPAGNPAPKPEEKPAPPAPKK